MKTVTVSFNVDDDFVPKECWRCPLCIDEYEELMSYCVLGCDNGMHINCLIECDE